MILAQPAFNRSRLTLLWASIIARLVMAAAASEQCSATDTGCSSQPVGIGDTWRQNASHDSTAAMSCSMPILDASTMSITKLAKRCANADTPLLIRGLPLKPKWRRAMGMLGNRSRVIQHFGDETVSISLGAHLAQGPEMESAELDAEKLAFMREAWAADGSAFRGDLLSQVQEGKARPQVKLADFEEVLHAGTVPEDAYVFHNVTGSRDLAAATKPLRRLWKETVLAQLSPGERAGFKWAHQRLGERVPDTGLLTPLMRLGLGGTGSGAPFHDHDLAFNFAFAGRKHWIIARPHQPMAVVGPSHMLENVLLRPSFQNSIQKLGRKGYMWQCTQQPGEAVFVPSMFLHTIINLDEALAIAIQAEDTNLEGAFAALTAGLDMRALLAEAREEGHVEFANSLSRGSM